MVGPAQSGSAQSRTLPTLGPLKVRSIRAGAPSRNRTRTSPASPSCWIGQYLYTGGTASTVARSLPNRSNNGCVRFVTVVMFVGGLATCGFSASCPGSNTLAVG